MWFAENVGDVGFTVSNEWLKSFRKRNNISFSVLSGEKRNVHIEIVDDWKKKLNFLYKNYSPDDIFNADETSAQFTHITN